MTKTNKNMVNEETSNIEIKTAKQTETMTANSIGRLEFDKFDLENVMYVPNLSTNLLSVGAVTEKNGEVVFTKDKVKIQHKGKTLLEGQRLSNSMYGVNLKQEEANLVNIKEDQVKLWHRRLGHICQEGLKTIVKITEGTNITGENIHKTQGMCDTCAKAKQVRRPFENSRSRATQPLQIIHTDVCGPIDPTTWDGNKYYVTFLDDFTNYIIVYLMKHKSEVTKLLKTYATMAETHHEKKIKRLRCDNGFEYPNKEVKDWCAEKGIQIEFTTPYTPQLNGKAERLNRTIMEKARSMLFDSKLSKNMWGEAVYCAAYLHNRTSTLTQLTPVENWTQRKPNVKGIKLFGCVAYAKILGPTKKPDERRKKLIHVGYAQKGYRLWDSQKQRIIVSRDVMFDEELQEEEKGQNKVAVPQLNEDEQDVAELPEPEEEEEQEEISPDTSLYEDASSDEQEPQEERHRAVTEPTPRRSQRIKRIPERLDDYVLLTYKDAVTGADTKKSKEAIEREKQSLEKNNTCTVIDSKEAEGSRPLTSK